MSRVAAIAIVALMSAGSVSAEGLDTYKATYERNIETIRLSCDMKMTTLGQEYTKALGVLLAKARTAGHLDRTKAVMNEIERFGNTKVMPDTSPASLDIQKLQSSYTTYARSCEIDRAQKVMSLASGYCRALERIQKRLVSSGKLDDAEVVQEERKSVEASDEYQAASALVTLGGPEKPFSTVQRDAKYTLTVVTKTGRGKYDSSKGGDRVRMFVFLGNDDANKKELVCGGFGRGSELTFAGIDFDYPLEGITRVSLICQGGTDAWGMDSISFQFFRKHKASKQYLFEERTDFSGERTDAASTLKSFNIPGGVQINRVFLRSGGLTKNR